MFTGIVEALGQVKSFSDFRLVISGAHWDDLKIGESIAVKGCCLTLVDQSEGLRFDLSEETLGRTTLRALSTGDSVNLERAMKLGDRFGGHVVQGHVDQVGEVVSVSEISGSTVIRVRIFDGGQRYLIDKGSITLDGISLTVVEPNGSEFDVHIIPHTWENTTLKNCKPGHKLNVEFDVLAKHVEKLLASKS